MYMSGGIDEKALNNVVPIIEQFRSNHEEAATHDAYQAIQGPKWGYCGKTRY